MMLVVRCTAHPRVQCGCRSLVLHIQWHYDCSPVYDAAPCVLLWMCQWDLTIILRAAIRVGGIIVFYDRPAMEYTHGTTSIESS